MCGFVAFVREEMDIPREKIQESLRVISHRGPDSQGLWHSRDGKVVLGHRRLSIIDLQTGDQPLHDPDNALHLVVNGEFYDFERIRQELRGKGHSFLTQSDSEIALPLFKEYGTGALHFLRGEFAFVLWDERFKTLFAARDRFGIKPLYYARIGQNFFFASEIKSLLALGVPARWNQNYLLRNLGVSLEEGQTHFQGIYQVPPAHYALVKDGAIQIHRYWDFHYPLKGQLKTNPTPEEEEHFIGEFRKILNESIRLRLRADVKVGCYLSVGLDSCSILGLAQAQMSTPIEAYTLTFDDQLYDEEVYARETAAKARANFHPIPIKQKDLAEHFAEAIWHSETLFFNGHGVAKYLLSRHVRDAGLKVVLTGEGSDEILAGYPHFRMDLWQEEIALGKKSLLEMEREMGNEEISKGILVPAGETVSTQFMRNRLGYVPAWLETNASNRFKFKGLLHQHLLSPGQQGQQGELANYEHFLNGLNLGEELLGRDRVNQSLYLWSRSFLPNYILNVLGDRMEMAHSLEGRVPFLDHHLVEFMRNVPVSLKIKDGMEKYLLREAAKPVLTETLYKRKKHPFLSPPSVKRREEPLYFLMQEVFRGKTLRESPFFDAKKVVGLLDRLPEMESSDQVLYDPVLTIILSTCLLQEKFHLT